MTSLTRLNSPDAGMEHGTTAYGGYLDDFQGHPGRGIISGRLVLAVDAAPLTDR